MMGDIVIKASNLTKSYNGFVAVGGISFEVARGQIFGFLGPNGAGKTTTIRILTGLSKPSSGKAAIMGFDVLQDIQKIKENIGLVPETSNIYSEMTAWDNLMFSGEIYGVPKAKRENRAHELLEAFRLSHRRKAKVKKFSRGMKRRLTLIMALLHEPAILFLDEPTTGLDVQSARYIRHLVRDLRDKGVTVFLTTHYIEEADQLCDRIAIINNGKTIAYDTPEGLKKSVEKGHALEISFEMASEGLLNDLNALGGIDSVERLGDKFRVYSGDTSRALSSLIGYAGKKDLKIISLNTLRPSLEEAFIKITGLSYGAMEEEKGEGRGKVAAL